MATKKKKKGRRSGVSFFISVKGKQIKINPERYFFYTSKGKTTTFGRWKGLIKKGIKVTKKLKTSVAIKTLTPLKDLLLFKDFYRYDVVIVTGKQESSISSKKVLQTKLKSMTKAKTKENIYHTKSTSFSKATVYFTMTNDLGTPILHKFSLYTTSKKKAKSYEYWRKKFKTPLTIDTANKITDYINEKSIERFKFDNITFLTLEN